MNHFLWTTLVFLFFPHIFFSQGHLADPRSRFIPRSLSSLAFGAVRLQVAWQFEEIAELHQKNHGGGPKMGI